MSYSPKIKEEQIRKLYQLKVKTRTPITKLVELAIDEFLKKHGGAVLNDSKRPTP